MNTNAPLSPGEKALALATKRAIQAADGLAFCEGETGVSDTHLSRCCSVNHRDSITIRDAVKIEQLGSGNHILKAMARQLGLLVIPVPSADVDGQGLSQSVIELGAEFGDVSRAVIAALNDGNCNASEASAVLEQLDQMDEVSARLRVQLRLLADEPALLSRIGPKGARA